jgi:hypothetical protein
VKNPSWARAGIQRASSRFSKKYSWVAGLLRINSATRADERSGIRWAFPEKFVYLVEICERRRTQPTENEPLEPIHQDVELIGARSPVAVENQIEACAELEKLLDTRMLDVRRTLPSARVELLQGSLSSAPTRWIHGLKFDKEFVDHDSDLARVAGERPSRGALSPPPLIPQRADSLTQVKRLLA